MKTLNLHPETQPMKQNLLLVVVAILLSVATFAQQRPWTLGASGGIFNYYGDASEEPSFNFGVSRPAGALSIERKFGSFFRPQLHLMAGQLYGQKQYLNVQLKSFHTEAALKLGFDVVGLIKPEAKLEIAPNVGFVAAYYNPKVTRISTNEEVVAPHINQGEKFGTGLAWGGRLGYQFNDTWRGVAGLDMRYYLTNEVDAYDGIKSTTNDWLSYFFVGVGYSFGSGGASGEKIKEMNPDRMFNGQFTHNNLPKEGVTMNMYDEKDNLVATAITDKNGNFGFNELKPEKDYTIKLEGDDRELGKGGKVYVLNEQNEKVAITAKNGDSRFVYKHLTQDEVNQMAAIKVDASETTMQGLFTYQKLAKSGVKLNLYDQSGSKVASTVTGINGQFKFEGLTPDEVYMVKLNEDDQELYNHGRLYILNSDGKRIAVAGKPKFNEYKFEHLTKEEADEMPVLVESDVETKMRGVFVYNDLPKAGVKLYMVDQEDNKLDSVVTGVDGSFQFSQLEPNAMYLVRINEGDVPDPARADLFFLNNEDEPVMRAGVERGEKFSFSALPDNEIAGLQVLRTEIAGEGKLMYRKESIDGEYVKPSENDTAAMRGFELTGKTPDSKDKPKNATGTNVYNVDFEKETIFFQHNKSSISQNQEGTKGSVIAKKLKDNPAMRIRIEGYASTPGTEAYNLVLSQRRADALKKLLVEKYGIDTGRIVAIGKGEDPSSSEEEARRARIVVLE